MSPRGLYEKIKSAIGGDVILFTETLDCLFALGQIDFCAETEELTYVGGNTM
jgi:hypothetical protein